MTHLIPVPPAKLLFEYLKFTGEVAMAREVLADTPFDYTIPLGQQLQVERIMITCVDDAKEMKDGFFTLAPLTLGLLIQVIDIDGVTVLQHFGTDSQPIRRHQDFGSLAGVDISESDSTGLASRFGIRWTISSAGATMILYGGQTFRIVVRDDLSDLTQFNAVIQGLIEITGQ